MVITLDKHKRPVGFTTEKRARKLMEARRACVCRYFPFTIILMDVDVRELDPGTLTSFRIKIDPGSKHTGISVIGNEDHRVYFYTEINHRGDEVRAALLNRRGNRRNRRHRETWYRRPKWGNKMAATNTDGSKGKSYDSPRPDGWLPPSLKSVADNVINFVKKLRKLINITECSLEAVRIDTQLMDDPDIEGKEYQHGTLYGYEMKEYLLDKYHHTCQYCDGVSGDPVMEWEHMRPKSRGGSDSVKNATLACKACNSDKDDRTPQEWLKDILAKKRKTRLDEARIENIPKAEKHQQAGGSSRYCAWVTATRRYIEKALFGLFGNVECSSGGRTKYNREQVLHLPKTHFYDALCVGSIPEGGYEDMTGGHYLEVTAKGRGTRFRGKKNKCGVITKKLGPRAKRVFGFMNGDIVAVDKPNGKSAGHHVGRVMVRDSGYFDIRTQDGILVNASYKYCRLLQYADGYQYRLAIPLGN